MRTKTLLLTAALVAAGVATSMAQIVYSVNSVGYINVTMKSGFNLVANQLTAAAPGNTLNNLFGQSTMPIEAQLLKFDNVTGTYHADIYAGGPPSGTSGWLDAISGDPSVTTVNPGEGVFFFNPQVGAGSDIVVTLVGEVPQGAALTVNLPPGFSAVSSIVPQAIPLTSDNGFPQILEMQYLTFDPVTGVYTSLINDGTTPSGWLNSVTGVPTPAVPAVAQGCFIFNPDNVSHSWVRSFSVSPPSP